MYDDILVCFLLVGLSIFFGFTLKQLGTVQLGTE